METARPARREYLEAYTRLCIRYGMATVKGPDQEQARACAEYARCLKKWCDDPTWEKIARMWDDSAAAGGQKEE